MTTRTVIAIFLIAAWTRADELIFRYEADVLASDPSTGFEEFSPCFQACTPSLQNGHAVFSWPRDPAVGERYFNYTKTIGIHPNVPLPPFWAEFRYSSNNQVGFSVSNDGTFVIDYRGVNDLIDMYGDAVISHGEDVVLEDLPLNQFRTYRFETISERDYCFWVDGVVFICDQHSDTKSGGDYLQIFGHGGVDQNQGPGPIINRWDFVRYGRITTGESIVSSNPPGGLLDAGQHPGMDRFTITFDQPNYVYVNDIIVVVLNTVANDPNPQRERRAVHPALALGVPMVTATRRLDNGPPETVEIALDRPLEIGVTTRFTFNTGGTPNTVEFTLVESAPCCLPGGGCQQLQPTECSAQNGLLSAACEGDADSDGVDGSCGDACPHDPAKLSPGLCGCGAADADSDSDTIVNCLDECPGRDDRIDEDENGISDCLMPPIPTASAWGLIILALLLVVVAKVLFEKRPFPNSGLDSIGQGGS